MSSPPISPFPQSDGDISRSPRTRGVPSLRGMNDESFRCRHCGEIIGVYEPMVVIVDGEPVYGSRAASTTTHGDGLRFHGTCFVRARAAGETPVE